MRLLTWLTSSVLIALVLSACGGGTTGTTPNNSNNSNEQSVTTLATAAQLTASFAPETQVASLSWKDTLPQGTQYAVQSQSTGGSFTTVETVSGAGGNSAVLNWQRPVTQTTTFRVQAQPTAGEPVTLTTTQQQSSVTVSVPSATPQIAVNTTEPVSGTVQLTIEGGYQYPGVSWYVDTRLIGQGTASAGNPINWNTSSETNEQHLVIARIQTSTDSYTDVRRTVQVSNVNLALTASVSATTGTINVDVSASSANGIARVEATFDGTPQPSLSEPNACSRFCSTNNLYRFTVDAAAAGSGNHSMVIKAVDRQGGSKTITVAVPVNNKPGLTVTAPVDGALVNGSLQLSGTATSDKSGAVTTTASLGELQFMNTTAANFNGTLDLTGLPAKTYTLTVSSKDSSNATTVVQRSITVTSSSALAYTPILSMGTGGQLVAAEGQQLLYRTGTESYRLRNTQTNTEVSLTGASTVANATDWQVSAGRVYAQGKDTDCAVTCIYQWSEDGSRRNLTQTNALYDLNPVARGDYVIWVNWAGPNNNGQYTVYTRSTDSFAKINMPAGTNYVGNTDYDITVEGGVLRFFFWGQTGGDGTSSTFDVYSWDASSNTSTKLSSGGARNIYPQTDGVAVIWQQTPIGGSTDSTSTLVSQPIAGGTSSTLAINATSLKTGDGVAAWVESTGSNRTLKARFAGSVRTLSTLSTATLYGTTSGQVVFGEQGKTYSWNANTNSSTLRLDTAPGQTITSGGYLYFVLGNGQTVYRVGL
jgi:hypothetical protein